MENSKIDTNEVVIAGIITRLEYSFSCTGEKFQKGIIKAKRSSGTFDEIPVVISERILEKETDYKDKFVEIKGNLRVYREKKPKEKFIYICFGNIYFRIWGLEQQ